MRNVVASCLLALLAAACGRPSPTAPRNVPGGTDAPGAPSISELRIAGLPRALSSGSTAQLTAEAVLQTGAVKECAATWSVDDETVATVSSSGLLTSAKSGYVNVAASCAGLMTRAETRVEPVGAYPFHIEPFDHEFGRSAGSFVIGSGNMRFLDGPRAGQSAPTPNFFSDGMPDVPWPVKVRFTADNFEPKDFILAETTGESHSDGPTLRFAFSVPMTFAQDPLTDMYVREMSDMEMVIVHPFTMRMPGPVQVRTWWSGHYNDVLTIELWCDGKRLRSGNQYQSIGGGFTHDVAAPGACEVKLRQNERHPINTRYRITVRYAR